MSKLEPISNLKSENNKFHFSLNSEQSPLTSSLPFRNWLSFDWTAMIFP